MQGVDSSSLYSILVSQRMPKAKKVVSRRRDMSDTLSEGIFNLRVAHALHTYTHAHTEGEREREREREGEGEGEREREREREMRER